MTDGTGHSDEFSEGQEDQTKFTIPYGIRLVLLWLSVAVLTLCIIGVFLKIFGGSEILFGEGSTLRLSAPTDISFSALLPVSLVATIMLALPWEKEDIRITQIGPIALERKIEGQAREQEIELAEIQNEIHVLRMALEAVPQIEKPLLEVQANIEKDEVSGDRVHSGLEKLLVDFLTKHEQWAFSPSRIGSYGGKQPGFGNLSSHSTTEIRSALRRLVKQHSLVTRVSKKGNTLYRIPV